MKKLLYALCALTLLVAACKKKKDTVMTPDLPGPAYHFNFVINGTESHHFTSDVVQHPVLEAYQAGGDMIADSSLGFMDIKFEWPVNDTVRDEDVLGLAGKTIVFSDTVRSAVSAYLTYTKPSLESWYSQYAGADLNVAVKSVTYVKVDTFFGTPFRRYVLTGTCNASLYHNPNSISLTNGSFTMAVLINNF